MTTLISVELAALLVAQIVMVVLLARHRCAQVAAPAPRPTEEDVWQADSVKTHVHAAVYERLEHEKEKPSRYPRDHREKSVLQRAKRRLHFANIPAPPDAELERLIWLELRSVK